MRASHLQGTVYPLATVTGWKGVLLCGSMFRPLALLLFLAVVDLGDTTASKEHARTRESHAPGVCQFCPGSLGDNSTIDRLCLSLEQTTSSDRCCMNRNGTVIGLDLSGCHLNTLNGSNMEIFSNITSVLWIDLTNTPLRDFATNFSVDSFPDAYLAFRGLSKLELLLLPLPNNCPGPLGSWLSSSTDKRHADNDTSSHGDIACHQPISPCTADGELLYFNNRSACSETSTCVPNGLGFRVCECSPGYRGYRCLYQGHFSYSTFFSALACTVFLIIAIQIIDVLRRRRARRASVAEQIHWTSDGYGSDCSTAVLSACDSDMAEAEL